MLRVGIWFDGADFLQHVQVPAESIIPLLYINDHERLISLLYDEAMADRIDIVAALLQDREYRSMIDRNLNYFLCSVESRSNNLAVMQVIVQDAIVVTKIINHRSCSLFDAALEMKQVEVARLLLSVTFH